MIKFLRITVILILGNFLANCSQVLQTVDLEINSEDNSSQENFNVIEKTLTIKEARKQKNAPYIRKVLQNGRGVNAQPIPEELALISRFPLQRTYRLQNWYLYVLTFSRLVDSNHSFHYNKKWPPKFSPGKYKLGVRYINFDTNQS